MQQIVTFLEKESEKLKVKNIVKLEIIVIIQAKIETQHIVLVI